VPQFNIRGSNAADYKRTDVAYDDFALQYFRSDRIVQINFGLTPNFGLNFSLRPELRPKFWSKTERLLSLEKFVQVRSKTNVRS